MVKGAKWDTNEISDVKVTAFGNTAIATGAWQGKGMADGKPLMPMNTGWTPG